MFGLSGLFDYVFGEEPEVLSPIGVCSCSAIMMYNQREQEMESEKAAHKDAEFWHEVERCCVTEFELAQMATDRAMDVLFLEQLRKRDARIKQVAEERRAKRIAFLEDRCSDLKRAGDEAFACNQRQTERIAQSDKEIERLKAARVRSEEEGRKLRADIERKDRRISDLESGSWRAQPSKPSFQQAGQQCNQTYHQAEQAQNGLSSVQKDQPPNTFKIQAAWGMFNPFDNTWTPNPNLDLSDDEQYEQNLANGHAMGKFRRIPSVRSRVQNGPAPAPKEPEDKPTMLDYFAAHACQAPSGFIAMGPGGKGLSTVDRQVHWSRVYAAAMMKERAK